MWRQKIVAAIPYNSATGCNTRLYRVSSAFCRNHSHLCRRSRYGKGKAKGREIEKWRISQIVGIYSLLTDGAPDHRHATDKPPLKPSTILERTETILRASPEEDTSMFGRPNGSHLTTAVNSTATPSIIIESTF